MANTNSILLLLLLLCIAVASKDVCEDKKCKCSTKSDKLRVDCRYQGITEIFPQDEFPKEMYSLDFSSNNISIIRQGFLDLRFKLERLYLYNNSITKLEERAFIGLNGLKRLNLRSNKLTQLHEKAFVGLTNLNALDLSTNKIESIGQHAFYGLKSLKKIDLSTNRIGSINQNAFYGLKSLKKLVLKKNSFTTILNGTFDQLSSLERLDMKLVPLRCDCDLNSFVAFIAKAKKLKVLGSCQSKEKLVELKKIDLCEKIEVVIKPSGDQIVSVGDSFSVVCETVTKRRAKPYWRKNQNPLPKHVQVLSHSIQENKNSAEKKLTTMINFKSVAWQDGGTYACHLGEQIRKEIVIKVVTSESEMCSMDDMKIGHDHFLWPVSVQRTTITVPCPWPNDKGTDSNVHRQCDETRVWGPVQLGNCVLVSIPEKMKLLTQLLKKSDDVDIKSVAEKLKLLTEDPTFYKTAGNITAAFNVFSGIILKNIPMKGKLLHDLLASFSNMMAIKQDILYASELRDQSPSRLGAYLESISHKMLYETTSYRLNNFVIVSVDIRKLNYKRNKTCRVFFKTGQPGEFYCDSNFYQGYSVSITIPGTMLSTLKDTGHSMSDVKLQLLVYRNANLFPHVISNTTGSALKERNISSSVLAIKLANVKELNLVDPIVIKFATQLGTDPVIKNFDFGKNVGTKWSNNTDCIVKESTASLTTVECRRLMNQNLAIMSKLGITNVDIYPVEVVVYLGAVVTSLLLIATLVTFALARNIRFNRDDIIMLMNACLALLVVVLSFAFGIDRTESTFVCRAMGMSLHFFFFASLLWLGSYVVCVTRRLTLPRRKKEESEPNEEVFNPVLMYYMICWGVPAIVCGMTVASNITNYKATGYCWLTESAGLGAFVGPACLLFLVNSVLLVRLHLVLARGNTDSSASEENTEEERLQADEPGVLEEISNPAEEQNTEKSSITLNLVATWVVMSLIYLNFILAYFLINSRSSKLRWIFLSYVYALANIALGISMFGFHCVARPEVRKAWKSTWKQLRAMNFSCGYPCRTLRTLIWPKRQTSQINGCILVNGQDVTNRIESDRQSNITLPSSAALTNDVFVNGRPMSSARLSLLDEVDFPPEENPPAGPQDNEIDVTETANSEGNRRSQSSLHSERKSKTQGEGASEISPTVPEVDEESQHLLPVPVETNEDNADIADGVTSKSESSAPTAIEVPQTPVRADSPNVQYPHAGPHPSMVPPFNANTGRSLPFPPNPALHPKPIRQFRPVFQTPYQPLPVQHVPPANYGPPANQVLLPEKGPPPPLPPANKAQPTILEPPPPSYQKALSMDVTSHSGSSVNDNTSRPNQKRQRSNESLGSKNESGSLGPRARKLPQRQAKTSGSSLTSEGQVPNRLNVPNARNAGQNPGTSNPKPVSEVSPTAQAPNHLSDTASARNAAQNLGNGNQRPVNRYRDGRAKPEPKQWNGSTQRRIAYVPIPHVSKIHREPLHNETSV